MAAYDLQEQDALADLKTFWAQWGKIISNVITAIALAIIAYQAYQWYNKSQAEKASVLYQAVSDAIATPEAAKDKAKDEKKELAKAKEATEQLISKYGSTAYAPRAALILAKLMFEGKDLDGAKAQLSWVAANAKEEELKQIARLRLATVLLDQKKYDEAIATLDGKFSPEFEGLALDGKGDAFMAAGRTGDAKAAYASALTKLDTKGQLRTYTQTKHDAIIVAAK